MAENKSDPLITMMTNPIIVHGSRRRATSDTGTSRITQPSRRKSNITVSPKKRHSVHT